MIILLTYLLNGGYQRSEAHQYCAIFLQSSVCGLIANYRSLMKTIDITVTVTFPISAVSNETHFF